MIVPVILAGGSGTRLWPLSRQSYPKQFLHLVDQQYTMLQLTLKRLENLSQQVLPPIIVCNENHRFIVAEQLDLTPSVFEDGNFLVDKEGKTYIKC